MRFIAKYRHVITIIITIICVSGLIFSGVRLENLRNQTMTSDTFTGIAMGTAIKKTIYSENTLINEEVNKEIDDCIRDVENQISVRITDSEVARCNRSHTVDGLYELSDDVIDYLTQEMEIYKETNGAFCPCIRPLAELWGIEEGKNEVPEDSRIKETLKSTEAVYLEIRDKGIVFHEKNMAIDFGAVGKGIACDRIVAKLTEQNVYGAVISVGGSIAVYGNKGVGNKWRIGIQDPRGEDGEVLGVIDFSDSKMIATSGDYEKYFMADGKRYHHILDPSTGYPVDNGLISVTIISDSGFLSDALSTACFVMGLDEGMDLAERKGVDAIFVTKDKEVYVTKNLKKNFHLKNDNYILTKKRR